MSGSGATLAGPRKPSLSLGAPAIITLGLALTSLVVFGVLALLGSTSYDIWSGVVVAPVLIAVSVLFFAREARRQGDKKLFWFLVGVLLLKLVFTLVRYYVTFEVYDRADAVRLTDGGLQWWERFSNGDYHIAGERLEGSYWIMFVTGIIFRIAGPGDVGGFLIFSWLAFVGLFLFYKAFCIAVPEGNRKTYGRLIFLFPSLLYWPSSIGKEAWMLFTLGILAYGAARALSGKTWRGLAIAALAIWLGSMVRPHVPGMAAIGLALAYVVMRPRANLGQLAPVAKMVTLAVAVVGAVFMVNQTNKFLEDSGIDTDEGISSTLVQTSERAPQGESKFQAAIIDSPADIPAATMTVLFRPFPFEANNLQALGTALEGTFLLVLSLKRLRWAWHAFKSGRRQPFVIFALVFVALFILAFSSFAVFGLLARQRVQVMPFYFVLFSIPPQDGDPDEDGIPAQAVAERAQ